MRFPHPSPRTPARVPAELATEPEAEDSAYDDEQDHDRCQDCKGTGWYVGLVERRYCPTCDGAGFV